MSLVSSLSHYYYLDIYTEGEKHFHEVMLQELNREPIITTKFTYRLNISYSM